MTTPEPTCAPAPNPLVADQWVTDSVRAALSDLVYVCTLTAGNTIRHTVAFTLAAHRSLVNRLAGQGCDEQAAWYVLAWEMANLVRRNALHSGQPIEPQAPPQGCTCPVAHELDAHRINAFCDAALGGDNRAALKVVQSAQKDVRATPVESTVQDLHELQLREVGSLIVQVSIHLSDNMAAWARTPTD